MKLDLIQTLALAGLALLVGEWLCRVVRPLSRYNVPGPVVGGLLVAVATLVARQSGVTLLELDTSLKEPLMVAFFTTIGFQASLSLLKTGGPQVLTFFLIAAVFAVLQNVVGGAVAAAAGQEPLFGVLAGSVTLTGGPATGLAFAPLFEGAGVPGAESIAVAAAMSGILVGGLIGGPIVAILVRRHGLRGAAGPGGGPAYGVDPNPPRGGMETLLPSLLTLLLTMWVGSFVSRGFAALGFTLPVYIGAMLVAAVVRNVADRTGWLRLHVGTLDAIGDISLALFLSMALMTLKLWELAGLVLPLILVVVAQIALVAVGCFTLVYRFMGRDYEAAVMSGGFCGFMLGTTANAMAIMKAVEQHHGRAPRAFLVVPMVGAFFIDFANALLITGCLNLFG